ncbi:hypothetical protein BDV19DRAFT_377260 [Aspergillus venezuelensis]
MNFEYGYLILSILLPTANLYQKELLLAQDRLFHITGGTSRIGFELAKILYRHGSKVYITGRTEEKAKVTIQAIKAVISNHRDKMDYIVLKLGNLTSIEASGKQFKAKDISKQGHKLQIAVNSLGLFLFMQLLLPLLGIMASAASDLLPAHHARGIISIVLNTSTANSNLFYNAELIKLYKSDRVAYIGRFAGLSLDIQLDDNRVAESLLAVIRLVEQFFEEKVKGHV